MAAGFAGLVCAIALAGCQGLPTVKVVQSSVAFEGGSCGITVNATNATPNTTYGFGMYTTGSPVDLGTLTSNSSGSINGMVSYPSNTVPRHYSNLYVEVFIVKSGEFGPGSDLLACDHRGVPADRLGTVVPSRTAVRLPSSLR